MKKLKNLVVLYPTFGTGGVTNNLVNFLNFSSKKKINIFLISDISNTDKKLFKKNRIKFINLKNKFFLQETSRILTSILSIFALINMFKNLNSKNTIIFSFQSHILPIIICKIFSWKIVIRNSEDTYEATKYADEKVFAYITLFMKYLFYRFANGIITNSVKSKKSLEKIVKNKTKLIFNPYIKKIYKYKNSKRENVILSVGRLCKQKNQSDIIRAFHIFLKDFPNFRLFIIGHGTDFKKLKNLSINLNLNNKIKFLGRQTKIRKFFITSKIFVFPSLYEGLPNVLIDSLNYNLPVISTRCSGSEDILGKNYKDFVAHNDFVGLSKKMIEVKNNYNSKLLIMKKSRKNLKRFLIKNQSIKYLEYCEKVL